MEVTWNKEFGNVVLPDNIDKIESGTVLEIKAEPKEGYAFKEWKVTASLTKTNSIIRSRLKLTRT